MKFSLLQTVGAVFSQCRLARLSIASKMLLGYLALAVLTVTVVVYALVNLMRLNSLNKGVIKEDALVQEAAGKMTDALLAQDKYEKHYLILRKKDIRYLFWKRGDEFRGWLAALKALPDSKKLPLKKVERLHKKYGDLFLRELTLVRKERIAEAERLSNAELKNSVEKLLDILRAMSAGAKASQEARMKLIGRIGDSAFSTTAVLCVLSVILGVSAGLIVTRHISSSLRKLKTATEQFSEGHFDYDPRITATDEIGTLSEAFRSMGKRLRKLEEMYLDASPLTRLPGGVAIEQALNRRLTSGQPVAFCVIDLDNFKAFNDRYGYAHGNEVIKEAGRIIETATRLKGTPDDFVGHVGGDDFVAITTPDHMHGLSEEIIQRFDQSIPRFYDKRDRENGYIYGKSRQGVKMNFPIMTISIAIVTNTNRKLSNPLEASEIAAELKDYAKTIPKSMYVVDKRRTP